MKISPLFLPAFIIYFHFTRIYAFIMVVFWRKNKFRMTFIFSVPTTQNLLKCYKERKIEKIEWTYSSPARDHFLLLLFSLYFSQFISGCIIDFKPFYYLGKLLTAFFLVGIFWSLHFFILLRFGLLILKAIKRNWPLVICEIHLIYKV